MKFGQIAGSILLVLTLLLIYVLLLSRSGTLGDWGRVLATQRESLRDGRPVPFLETNPPDAPVADTLPNVRTAIAAQPNLGTALNLYDSAEILSELPLPSTIFLPNDDAFAAMPQEALTALQNNPEVLRNTLRHHVVRGSIRAADIVRFSVLPTLNGSPIPISSDIRSMVGGANVTAINRPFDNGLIHVIDQVLLPSNNLSQPQIETPDGVATVDFRGELLTVVGSAEPFTRIMLHSNGVKIGESKVEAGGNWKIETTVTPGTYKLLAWMLSSDPQNPLPLAVSQPVLVNVLE